GVVAPPVGNDSFTITQFSFEANTGAFSLTFESEANATYALEYSTGLLPSGAADSANWNTAPGFGSVTATSTSTTLTGNISALMAPTGTLPNASRSFFRVRKL